MSSGQITFGTGRAQIRVSGSAFDVARRVLETAAPRTTAELDRATTKLAAEAKSRWPFGPPHPHYKSGKRKKHSKYQIEHGIRIEDGGRVVVGFVRNVAYWAYYIKWGPKQSFGFRRGARVALDLIYRPGRKEAKPLAAAIAADLRDAAIGR